MATHQRSIAGSNREGVGAARGWTRIGLAAATALLCHSAFAIEYDLDGVAHVKMDNNVSVGALWRTEAPKKDLIGKSNLNPGLCVRRNADGSLGGDTCPTSDSASNQNFIDHQGAFSLNGDDGDLNFKQGDLVAGNVKWTSDISVATGPLQFFIRPVWFFDKQYNNFIEKHPDTTLEPARTKFDQAGRRELGTHFSTLDWWVSGSVPYFGGRSLNLKLGNQVIDWGESAFLLLNSLNTVNAPDLSRIRAPGSELREFFKPLGMLDVTTNLTNTFTFEGFYNYQWKPVGVDPVGSFFSTSDLVGAGGRFAALSFGKAPEDPDCTYRPIDNPDDPLAALGSTACRTIFRNFDEEERRKPQGGGYDLKHGSFGFALRNFFENLGTGTEIGLYAMRYHSRLPVVSAIAAQPSCLSTEGGGTNSAADILPGGNCGNPPSNLAAGQTSFQPAAKEAIPVDTAQLVVEYPKKIRLYGISFNTQIGDWALTGEYTYRPNLPIQVDTTDVVFAALQPAFPNQDVPLGAATIPGRRSAVPDFVETNFRGETVTPGMFIKGYERMKQGQADVTLLRLWGGDNLIGASQITFLAEAGVTHVLDFPHLRDLQFQGAIDTLHISGGADGSQGTDPADIRANPPANTSRQNPTTARRSNFGDALSYGYRLINLNMYDDVFLGVNVETILGLFHDVHGNGPGIGQNFLDGRMEAIGGLRFDYLTRYNAQVTYSYYKDGGTKDPQRDRDNVAITLGFQF